MSTLFDVDLTPDQHNLLATIAAVWADRGDWPLWGNIQHHFDMRGKDADAIFHSLPRIGSEVPYAAGYGFTTAMRAPIGESDRVRLTVAASLVLPEVRMTVGEPFVQALRHMIELYTSRPVLHDQVPDIMLRSNELKEALPHLKWWFVKVFPDLLSYEPGISTGGAAFNGGWERTVTRSVMQYRGVHNVEEYVEITSKIVMANASQYASFPGVEEAPDPVAEPEQDPYIDLALLDDLKAAAAKTRWQVHKLIALCQGLNDAYAAGNPYLCNMAIRAIMDHIPPVFAQPDFKQVAAQHTFTMKQTDKAHAQFLVAFKPIGDDVMHRQIGRNVPSMSMGDVPQPVRLRAVLHEVLEILRNEPAATP